MAFLQSIFRRPDYDSEITQFISGLKEHDPGLEAKQRAGRALLWDRKINSQDWDEFRAAQLRQQAYVYQAEPTK